MVHHVIFDSNIWISFAIGKRLKELQTVLTHPNIKVYVCRKLLWEVNGNIQKPKFLKYISPERRQMLLELMEACHCVEIEEQITISRDPKDNFLLDLASKVNADFLITGDNDLLVLKKFQHTTIVSFVSFMTILDILDEHK
jgi:putative PIN family toxin of toxin-antitoxin system